MATQPLTPGGGFLLSESDAQDIHTPEDFTDEHHLLVNTIRSFVMQEVVPRTDAIEAKEPGLMPELLKKAGELGLLSIEVPQQFGGAGMGLTYGMLLMETAALGGGSFLTSIADHIGIGTLPIVYSGSDALRQRYLPLLATGEKLGCYCLTEPQSGSDALAAQTAAELSPDGTHYLLTGSKHFITNAAFSDLYTVFAKVDRSLFTAFVVERDAVGLTIGKEEHKMGIVGSSTCTLNFGENGGCRGILLGEPHSGMAKMFQMMNEARMGCGVQALGLAASAYDTARFYAKERARQGKTALYR